MDAQSVPVTVKQTVPAVRDVVQCGVEPSDKEHLFKKNEKQKTKLQNCYKEIQKVQSMPWASFCKQEIF